MNTLPISNPDCKPSSASAEPIGSARRVDRFGTHREFVRRHQANVVKSCGARAALLWLTLWDYEDARTGLVRVSLKALARCYYGDPGKLTSNGTHPGVTNIAKMIRSLVRAGYLLIVEEGRRGPDAKSAVYRLAIPLTSGQGDHDPVVNTTTDQWSTQPLTTGQGDHDPVVRVTTLQREYTEQETEEYFCPEPDKPASGPDDATPADTSTALATIEATEPPILTFPCVGTAAKEWHLNPEKLAEWQAAFPAVDILAECRRALQWLLDNPTRRKTAAGMTRFIGSWLGRANDRGGPARPAPGAGQFLDHGARAENRITAQVREALADWQPAEPSRPEPQTSDLPPQLDTAEFRDTYRTWLRERHNIGRPAEYKRAELRKLAELGAEASIRIIDRAIRRSEKSLTLPA
jgi:hypothetical protein